MAGSVATAESGAAPTCGRGRAARSGGERIVGSAGVERDGRSGVERDGRARGATTSSGAVPPAPHAAGEPGTVMGGGGHRGSLPAVGVGSGRGGARGPTAVPLSSTAGASAARRGRGGAGGHQKS